MKLNEAFYRRNYMFLHWFKLGEREIDIQEYRHITNTTTNNTKM